MKKLQIIYNEINEDENLSKNVILNSDLENYEINSEKIFC